MHHLSCLSLCMLKVKKKGGKKGTKPNVRRELVGSLNNFSDLSNIPVFNIYNFTNNDYCKSLYRKHTTLKQIKICCIYQEPQIIEGKNSSFFF